MSKRAAATFESLFACLHERLSTGKEATLYYTMFGRKMSIEDLERFLLEELVEQTIAVTLDSGRTRRIVAKHIRSAIELDDELRRCLVA